MFETHLSGYNLGLVIIDNVLVRVVLVVYNLYLPWYSQIPWCHWVGNLIPRLSLLCLPCRTREVDERDPGNEVAKYGLMLAVSLCNFSEELIKMNESLRDVWKPQVLACSLPTYFFSGTLKIWWALSIPLPIFYLSILAQWLMEKPKFVCMISLPGQL